MRKVIMFNRVSLDGYFAGPHGESHEWFVIDPKVDKAAHKMMRPDTVLFGRETYQIFESYWPKVATDKKAPKQLRDTADELNEMNKIVFSKTLKEVTWQNSQLIKGDLMEEVRKLKRGKGDDMVIFGSGTIVQQLTDDGLIDEYMFIVTPVILGAGKSMFNDVSKLALELIDAKNFKSGNVLAHYRVGKKGKKEMK